MTYFLIKNFSIGCVLHLLFVLRRDTILLVDGMKHNLLSISQLCNNE